MCLHCEILGEGSSSRELECLNDSLYPPWAVMQARDKPPLYLENDIGVSCIPGYVLQLSSLSHSSFIANLRRTRAPLYGCASVLMRDPATPFSAFMMQLPFSSLSPDAGVLLDALFQTVCSAVSPRPTPISGSTSHMEQKEHGEFPKCR